MDDEDTIFELEANFPDLFKPNVTADNELLHSGLLNGTDDLGQDWEELIKSYRTNRRLDEPYFTLFISAYTLLIAFGTMGNLLVVSTVARKSTMRTARNIFILNLAVSDLLLCVITMPLTLMEILAKYWPLGSNVFTCKLFGSLQATSIFVSTISITAIALDRYQVIVYPTKASLQRVGAIVSLAVIWLISCCLAAPLFIWRKLDHFSLALHAIGITEVNFCVEEWPTEYGRAYYSIFTIIVQYFVPVTIVSVAYLGICKKLRYRMRPGLRTESRCQRNSGADRDTTRVRRTNRLLISIALVFGISWMPLNVCNVISDIAFPFKDHKQNYLIIYAICHMVGMSSACSNPILYAYLNENFRKEFKEIGGIVKAFCCRIENVNHQRGQSISRRNDHEHTTVHYKKSKASPTEPQDVEQSTLITRVMDRV